MKRILRQYALLADEQFGQIAKLCLKYDNNEEITENDAKREVLEFFNTHVRKEIDQLKKDRNRKRGAKNEG